MDIVLHHFIKRAIIMFRKVLQLFSKLMARVVGWRVKIYFSRAKFLTILGSPKVGHKPRNLVNMMYDVNLVFGY